jgi:hypothetical protein
MKKWIQAGKSTFLGSPPTSYEARYLLSGLDMDGTTITEEDTAEMLDEIEDEEDQVGEDISHVFYDPNSGVEIDSKEFLERNKNEIDD